MKVEIVPVKVTELAEEFKTLSGGFEFVHPEILAIVFNMVTIGLLHEDVRFILQNSIDMLADIEGDSDMSGERLFDLCVKANLNITKRKIKKSLDARH